jgi:hypothetical protein
MSKGSNRRPSQVPQKKVDENWERIFGKKKKDNRKKEA